MKLQFLDKFGAVGAFVAAISCPACFPLLAVVGATLGLGFLRPYEGYIMYVFQGLVVLSLAGSVLSYLNHKKKLPLVISVLSSALIFFAFYIRFNVVFLYVGLGGLMLSATISYFENRKCKTCPP